MRGLRGRESECEFTALSTVRIVICVNLRDIYGATCFQRTHFSDVFKRMDKRKNYADGLCEKQKGKEEKIICKMYAKWL